MKRAAFGKSSMAKLAPGADPFDSLLLVGVGPPAVLPRLECLCRQSPGALVKMQILT